MDPIFRHGHVTRADGDDETLRVVLANEGRMGDGLDLRMDGADLDRFNSNPVLGYGHMYFGRDSLPIGRVDNVSVDGDSMSGDLQFDQSDEFAVAVERKMRDGFLSAVSIGFDPRNVDDDGTVTDWELFEVSVVPIPMDPDAVVSAGRVGARALRADLLNLASKLEEPDAEPQVSGSGFEMTINMPANTSSDDVMRALQSLSERTDTGRSTEGVDGGAGGDANTISPQARDRVLKLSGVIQ